MVCLLSNCYVWVTFRYCYSLSNILLRTWSFHIEVRTILVSRLNNTDQQVLVGILILSRCLLYSREQLLTRQPAGSCLGTPCLLTDSPLSQPIPARPRTQAGRESPLPPLMQCNAPSPLYLGAVCTLLPTRGPRKPRAKVRGKLDDATRTSSLPPETLR